MREMLPYFALLISVISCAIATWTAVRAGRWRDSEAAKALVDRISSVERTSGLHAQRIEQIEEDIEGLPTKADFARLEGEVKTTCKIGERVEKAVLRLEDYWLKDAKS